MGLIDNIVKRISSLRSKGWYEAGNLGSFLGIGTAIGREMQSNRGWVYAAVNAISEAMASIDFVLYEKNADGTVTELKEHELLDLLDGVNPTMTGYELKHRTGSHLELAGNAFWLLMNAKGQPVTSATEIPTAIYPLNPSKVKVQRGTFPELVELYTYTDRATVTAYQPHQILHLKYPNPSDDIMGLAPVEALRTWIETEQSASAFQLAFFQNNAKVGGILKSSKTLQKEQIEILRAQWVEMQQGLRNAYKPVIMPDYLTYEDNTKNQQEMDFVNSLNELRDKTLAGLRVPKTLLGNAEGSTNRATAETATYVFASYTIKPKMKLITAYLNEFLVPRFGENLYLGFRDPVPENRDAQLAEMQAAMGAQASITINEARERFLGLPAIEGGNSIFAPITSVAVATETQNAKAAVGGTKPMSTKAVTSGQPGRTQSSRNAEKRAAFAKTLATAALGAVKETLTHKSIEDLTDEEYSKVWKAKIARVTPYETKTAAAIKAVNAKTKAEVKKNLATSIKAIGSKKAVDPSKLVADNAKYAKLIVNAVVPIQVSLFDTESKEASAMIGVGDVELVTPAVKKAIETSAGLMADSYTQTTIDKLTATLDQGIEDGLGLDDLSDLVDGVFEYSDTTRADAVARTETTRISNDAKVEAWKQSGIVKSKMWYTADDERVCPYCDMMNGTEIDLGDTFFDEGDTVDGSDDSSMTADYSDVGGPPLHPNCRCDLRPSGIES